MVPTGSEELALGPRAHLWRLAASERPGAALGARQAEAHRGPGGAVPPGSRLGRWVARASRRSAPLEQQHRTGDELEVAVKAGHAEVAEVRGGEVGDGPRGDPNRE